MSGETYGDHGLVSHLFSLRDGKYAAFHAGLVPDISPDAIIGVRMPQLRASAKEMMRCGLADEFIRSLPHRYYEEYQIHSIIISSERLFDKAISETEEFLPYIDNWAVCDSLSPAAFAKNRAVLIPRIYEWLGSERIYTVRFAVGMLMKHFLGDDYSPEYPEAVASLRRGEYYIRMMQAWYFCTALTKRYEDALPFIEDGKLDAWTHNKTIQKCAESRAIPEDRKKYLKSLKTDTKNQSSL